MKLSEFYKNLGEILEKRPDFGELTVVSSADDEGNYFNEVHFTPSLGEFEDGEFRQHSNDPDQDPEDMVNPKDINSICIN